MDRKKILVYIVALIIVVAGVIFFPDDDEATENNFSADTSVSDISEDLTESETESEETTDFPEISEIIETVTEEETEIFHDEENYVEYHFRSAKLLNEHFEKHGGEFVADFGYQTAEEYEKGACDVINNPDALFKYEAEDVDGVYYIENTNEFVVLSTDGYIRTYFRPTGKIDYFNRQ
ncbi:MAG: hypothetical protein K2J08_06840 [Ruminococcus sp.]|nr:hypothetical protein [Ruminococcus sp.]